MIVLSEIFTKQPSIELALCGDVPAKIKKSAVKAPN